MHPTATHERARLLAPALAATCAVFGFALFAPARLAVPLLWLFAGGLGIFAWIRATVAPRYRPALYLGALLGLILRSGTAWVVVDYVYRFSDTLLYWYLGTRLADTWANPGIASVDIVRTVGTATWGYFVWTALHALILRDQILTSLSNAIIGTASGVLTYHLGRRIRNDRVGLAGAWLVWLSSAHIIVDAHSLRDTISTFTILAMVYGAHRLTEQWNWRAALWFGAGFAGLVLVRVYVAVALVPAIGIAFPLMARRNRLRLAIGLIAATVIAGAVVATSDFMLVLRQLGEGNEIVRMLRIAYFGLTWNRSPGSALAGVHLNSVTDMILFIPVGMVHILFSPKPWAPTRVDVGFVPDVIARYAMMPLLFVGFWDALRRHRRQTLLVGLVLLSGMVLYAMIEMGGNVRHNMQFFPYYYLFVAMGWGVARRYAPALWCAYALVSLAVWVQGMTIHLSLRFLPGVFLGIAIWLAVFLVRYERRERLASR